MLSYIYPKILLTAFQCLMFNKMCVYMCVYAVLDCVSSLCGASAGTVTIP